MAQAWFGIYPATVTDNADPQGRRRLQISVAAVGIQGQWAEVCLSGRASSQPPRGSVVWVMFEAGDPGRPVWLGRKLAS